MERYGKLELEPLVGKTRKARNNPARRKRYVPGAKVWTASRVYELERAHGLVVVRERLAHPHHDKIGERAVLARGHDLGDNLVRTKRTDDSLGAARAERASHRASDLSRNALRKTHGLFAAVGTLAEHGNDHGLDKFTVRHLEKKFLRSVRRGVARDLFSRDDRKLHLQRLPEILGQSGGLIPVGNVVAIERLQNLVGAERTQPALLQKRFPLIREYGPCWCSHCKHTVKASFKETVDDLWIRIALGKT